MAQIIWQVSLNWGPLEWDSMVSSTQPWQLNSLLNKFDFWHIRLLTWFDFWHKHSCNAHWAKSYCIAQMDTMACNAMHCQELTVNGDLQNPHCQLHRWTSCPIIVNIDFQLGYLWVLKNNPAFTGFSTQWAESLKGNFSSGIEGALPSTLNHDFNWKQLSEMIICIFLLMVSKFIWVTLIKKYK